MNEKELDKFFIELYEQAQNIDKEYKPEKLPTEKNWMDLTELTDFFNKPKEKTNKDLEDEVKHLKDENEKLITEVNRLKTKNNKFRDDLGKFKEELDNLKTKIEQKTIKFLNL